MSFNWRLLLAPGEILDYVVEHEVAHLSVHDHSQRFWRAARLALPGVARARALAAPPRPRAELRPRGSADWRSPSSGSATGRRSCSFTEPLVTAVCGARSWTSSRTSSRLSPGRAGRLAVGRSPGVLPAARLRGLPGRLHRGPGARATPRARPVVRRTRSRCSSSAGIGLPRSSCWPVPSGGAGSLPAEVVKQRRRSALRASERARAGCARVQPEPVRRVGGPRPGRRGRRHPGRLPSGRLAHDGTRARGRRPARRAAEQRRPDPPAVRRRRPTGTAHRGHSARGGHPRRDPDRASRNRALEQPRGAGPVHPRCGASCAPRSHREPYSQRKKRAAANSPSSAQPPTTAAAVPTSRRAAHDGLREAVDQVLQRQRLGHRHERRRQLVRRVEDAGDEDQRQEDGVGVCRAPRPRSGSGARTPRRARRSRSRPSPVNAASSSQSCGQSTP